MMIFSEKDVDLLLTNIKLYIILNTSTVALRTENTQSAF